MHRAALRAFRTTSTYLSAARHLSRSSPSGASHRVPTSAASDLLAKRRQQHSSAHVPLKSSMFFRRLPVALVSGLVVGYGAWYSLNSASVPGGQAVSRSFTSTQGASYATPTRTVLVVGADELRQGTIVGEGPISKPTGDDGQRIVEMLTPGQATQKLRRLEQSFSVNRGEGVIRYDLAQLPSNDPIEDDHAEKIVEVPSRSKGPDGSSDWMFWGVFDGHSGWTTSATLRESLISYVARELNNTYKAAKSPAAPAPDAIDLAIKTGFNRLDHEIVHKSVEKVFKASSKTVAAELLQPALSGSCALLSFYDSKSKLLRVACTGDSRAVLGRRSDSGKWTATALSEDQTGSNPQEAARMRKEHPGEDNVVRNGRVLGGLEPSRAFGDAVYNPSPLLKTPPYVTAEPIITTTKIEPEKCDFLVLATDGLWEMLTNDEVVGLVGQWIETQAAGSSSSSQFDSAWSKVFGSHTKDRFTVKDKNVATHLVRNALGGTNDEQVCALLTLPAPFSRRYRDDLTVQVIFFGNGERTGEVTLNLEATAEQDAPKAKL
ncbi:protein phosphatase 2C domain-containing protein [Hirsutella rhossiliensis]|uniref:Protein phosphatase 2C domain-containing protein n=1 Tax=Hirsutella rhossiliensis TaxID=111463 RepID=A0A9P8SL46_9HYPO|nr:protein phosphatase 2C domain-containing protein [Hirsutella rhossiliensis]KAH0967083.1 protein phosphatase 2C domain-containing protein [Hirsutella rhossiliensis]